MTPDEKAHADATAILREDDPRTPAEQQALDAIARYRWVPVHARDWNTAIVRLISIAGLLRDKHHEAEMDRAALVMTEATARDCRLDAQHISALDSLVEQAARRLDAGDAPDDVAAWLREQRSVLIKAIDNAKRAHLTSDTPAGVHI
jgi:hypothetical protein